MVLYQAKNAWQWARASSMQPKRVGEVGPVLHGLELRLRERVVVGDVGPAVALGDVQIDQQGGHRLGAHAGAAIGVQGERAGLDVVAGHGLGDQLLGQLGALALGDHPADDVAAEDVEDHVEVEAGPLGRPLELGDVPRPDLVGRDGQQLGLGVGRMGELVAPLARSRRWPPAGGTWCAPSRGSGPRRAAWRARPPARCRRSARC